MTLGQRNIQSWPTPTFFIRPALQKVFIDEWSKVSIALTSTVLKHILVPLPKQSEPVSATISLTATVKAASPIVHLPTQSENVEASIALTSTVLSYPTIVSLPTQTENVKCGIILASTVKFIALVPLQTQSDSIGTSIALTNTLKT